MTDNMIRLLLLIIIGGLIGYVTNKVAIKMLFRPVNPVNFGLFKLQGVFPKRKDQMAVSLAQTIEKELLSKEVIMDKILSEDKIDAMKTSAKDILVDRIVQAIPPMFMMFIKDDPKEFIGRIVHKEGDKIFDEVLESLKEKGMENVNIEELVKERIDQLDFIEFERIIFGLMNRELRFVEIFGLFLGAFIGVLQFLVTLVF